MKTYGPEFMSRWGTADRWPVWAQITAAERAYYGYAGYGGRGITMCDKWLNDFSAFLADMGEAPEGLTLERKDVNGGYSPENCVWASYLVQRRNQRRCL